MLLHASPLRSKSFAAALVQMMTAGLMTASCTGAPPNPRPQRQVSSALRPVVTASWKGLPATTANADSAAAQLDLSKDEDIRTLLARQTHRKTHDNCKRFLSKGNKIQTVAAFAKQLHQRSEGRDYACVQNDDGHFCEATFRMSKEAVPLRIWLNWRVDTRSWTVLPKTIQCGDNVDTISTMPSQ